MLLSTLMKLHQGHDGHGAGVRILVLKQLAVAGDGALVVADFQGQPGVFQPQTAHRLRIGAGADARQDDRQTGRAIAAIQQHRVETVEGLRVGRIVRQHGAIDGRAPLRCVTVLTGQALDGVQTQGPALGTLRLGRGRAEGRRGLGRRHYIGAALGQRAHLPYQIGVGGVLAQDLGQGLEGQGGGVHGGRPQRRLLAPQGQPIARRCRRDACAQQGIDPLVLGAGVEGLIQSGGQLRFGGGQAGLRAGREQVEDVLGSLVVGHIGQQQGVPQGQRLIGPGQLLLVQQRQLALEQSLFGDLCVVVSRGGGGRRDGGDQGRGQILGLPVVAQGLQPHGAQRGRLRQSLHGFSEGRHRLGGCLTIAEVHVRQPQPGRLGLFRLGVQSEALLQHEGHRVAVGGLAIQRFQGFQCVDRLAVCGMQQAPGLNGRVAAIRGHGRGGPAPQQLVALVRVCDGRDPFDLGRVHQRADQAVELVILLVLGGEAGGGLKYVGAMGRGDHGFAQLLPGPRGLLQLFGGQPGHIQQAVDVRVAALHDGLGQHFIAPQDLIVATVFAHGGQQQGGGGQGILGHVQATGDHGQDDLVALIQRLGGGHVAQNRRGGGQDGGAIAVVIGEHLNALQSRAGAGLQVIDGRRDEGVQGGGQRHAIVATAQGVEQARPGFP